MVNAGRILIIARGEWDNTTNYVQLDLVTHEKIAYLARKASVGVNPENDPLMEYWQPFGVVSDVATTTKPGLVMPDGTTITVDATGLIRATPSIEDIKNVSIVSLANKQVLRYNTSTQKWENISLGAAAEKNSTNAVTENSTALVESGAVFSELAKRDAEIADMNNVLGAKNLLPKDHYKAVSTSTGVTTTINADGSISLSGQFTVQTSVLLCDSWTVKEVGWIKELEGKKVKFSGNVANLNMILRLTTSGGNDDKGTGYDVDGENEFTMPTDVLSYALYIYPNSSTLSVEGLTIRPMLRLASIQDDTYEPYSMTNREMTPYVQAISNPNLIDNPWFTVNQRGVDGAITATGYFVDRWVTETANQISYDAANHSITIPSIESSSGLGFVIQKLEPSLVKDIQGKTVTMSAIIDGALISKTINIKPNGQITDEQYYPFNDGFYIGIYIKDSSSEYNFRIRKSGSGTVTSAHVITAVKIELGSVSTLAMDTAPNYATELLKCQRYFVRLKTDNVYGALSIMGRCGSTSDARITLFLPATMRRSPNISIGGSIMIHDDTANSNINDVTLGQNTMTSFSGHFGVVKITSTNNEYTVGHMVEIFAKNDANAYIDLTADI